MSGISGVGSSYSYTSMYGKIASGKRIQSAADDAAGLAISEKLDSQARGLDVGSRNASSGRDLLNVSDGALGTITDSLQRMRELALKAINGLYTDDQKQMIQDEVDQLKQGIQDTADQTTFNTKHILNGEDSFQLATDSNGNRKEISTSNAALKALGIEDFDVTGDFSLDTIDKALEKVTSDRARGGAQYNALGNTISYNDYASQNTTTARSRLSDLDIPGAVNSLKKNQLLQTIQIMMQKNRIHNRQQQNFNILGR